MYINKQFQLWLSIHLPSWNKAHGSCVRIDGDAGVATGIRLPWEQDDT